MSEIPTSNGPNKRYRTYVLILLTIVYGFNFIDRQIVGILAPWIQADLELTNTQMGLLIGLAFAVFYTVMGIPIAFIADRVNRKGLLAIALATWSGFTALTGFAQNFLHIGLARIGVGVGEAGGSPPSHSMISDLYGKEERAGALGVYSLGIPLGIMSAYFITVLLMGADPAAVDWRRIFVLLGVSGILLAVVVFFTIREPKRGAMETKSNVEVPKIPFGQALGTLLTIKSWWWMSFGIAFASFAAYALSGFQTKYIGLMEPDMSGERLRQILIFLGIINGLFYASGTFLGARFVDKQAKKSVRAYGWIPAVSIMIALPIGLLSLWVPSINMHLMLIAPFQFLLGVYLGPSFAIAQTLAPVHIRAMSTALFFFILNMIALGGGPTVAGFLIDVFASDTVSQLEATRYALMSVFGSFAIAIFSFMMVSRTLPKDWDDADARNRG